LSIVKKYNSKNILIFVILFSLTSRFGKYIMKLNFGTRYYFIY